MASYALLNTLSGFSFDMVNGSIGFDPIWQAGSTFQCFWSLDSGWGEYVQREVSIELGLLYGSLRLTHMNLPQIAGRSIRSVTIGGRNVGFDVSQSVVTFEKTVTIQSGETVVVEL
jgi:hypothetical protein